MVQVYSSIVMSDMIACLFSPLAFFAFNYIVKNNKRFENVVTIYENTLAKGKVPQVIEIDMELSLGRTIGLYRNGDGIGFRDRPIAE